MSLPFFRPSDIHAGAIILVGYRMFPFVRVDLHPRLTLLAGGNGAGKTTILDALQTILIADQRYLHLNVAAGQNDREFGGQIHGRVAWAILALEGHSEVAAIGTCLLRRPASQNVDIKPFALQGIAPERDHFIDLESSVIVGDFRSLQRNVARHSSEARVKEFASVSDYHGFLHDAGLLPIDLSRGGKKQFAMLWRQATRPHLGELAGFLQKTLCHEPERRLTFDDVERLMHERLNIERQLRRLAELRALHTELLEKIQEVDRQRRRFLGMELGIARRREESVEKELKAGEEKLTALEQSISELKERLDASREELSDIGRIRDGYLREQGELSRKYKHYREYVAHKNLMEETASEIADAEEEIYPLETRLKGIRDKIARLREEGQSATADLSLLREKEKELEQRVRRWSEFQKELDRVKLSLEVEIGSASELESTWSRISEERRKIQELKPLKQLLAQWETRTRAHEAAQKSARSLVEMWPEYFQGKPLARELLDEAQEALRARERDIAVQKSTLARSKEPVERLIKELPRGRLPLPSGASALVEKGLADSFIEHFDDLGLAEARESQDLIGPFSRAVTPANSGASLDELAHGKEPFLLVLSPNAAEEMRVLARTEEGVIAGFANVAWYTPAGPVWIGAEARRQQIVRAQDKILEIDESIKSLEGEEGLINQRMSAIRRFLPDLDAFSDSEAPHKAEQLRDWVRELEHRAPKIEKVYPMLQRLFQKSELFNYIQSPDEIESLRAHIKEREESLRSSAGTVRDLGSKEAECASEANSAASRLQSLRKDFDRIQTICSRLEEEEMPEVLQGSVDFGKSEELASRVRDLDEQKEDLQESLLAGEREHGELRNRFRAQGELLARLRRDREASLREHANALEEWRSFHGDDDPAYLHGFGPGEREQCRASWDAASHVLKGRLAQIAEHYEIKIPDEGQPDGPASHILDLLLPPGVPLEQLETQYTRLNRELQQIEIKIKSHVEEVKAGVDAEVRRVRVQISKVNRILSTLRFGQIKKIRLEMEELPAYQALKRLESLVHVVTRGEVLTLKEFIEKLRLFIRDESNTILSEEQIADYRSYIRIRRIIVDSKDRLREGGMSSGETLGVNLSLCLSILFFLGREQGNGHGRGLLMLALDEAERLDGKALETIRTILDEVQCQLAVAMPRPVDIPDCVCHLLTPLSYGVTHVHLYRKGADGDASPGKREG